jgi:hypothetical protein
MSYRTRLGKIPKYFNAAIRTRYGKVNTTTDIWFLNIALSSYGEDIDDTSPEILVR